METRTPAHSYKPVPSSEPLITLAEAARLVPGRKRRPIGAPAVRRWCESGYRGIILEHVRRPEGDYLTSRAAVYRFLEAVTLARRPERMLPPDRWADAVLDGAGV